MENKELKKIMTDLAAGHISKKEAEELIKPEKTRQIKPKQEVDRKKSKNTHKRKKSIKSKEVK